MLDRSSGRAVVTTTYDSPQDMAMAADRAREMREEFIKEMNRTITEIGGVRTRPRPPAGARDGLNNPRVSARPGRALTVHERAGQGGAPASEVHRCP